MRVEFRTGECRRQYSYRSYGADYYVRHSTPNTVGSPRKLRLLRHKLANSLPRPAWLVASVARKGEFLYLGMMAEQPQDQGQRPRPPPPYPWRETSDPDIWIMLGEDLPPYPAWLRVLSWLVPGYARRVRLRQILFPPLQALAKLGLSRPSPDTSNCPGKPGLQPQGVDALRACPADQGR